jgi:hypothetical protein
MTNLEFRIALKKGSTDVIFTDIDGKEYTHTILKAGKKQVNLYNNFLKREYKLRFCYLREGLDFKNYRLK